MITYDLASSLWHYDPETGVVTWKCGLRKGRQAGSPSERRYRRIVYAGRQLYEHHIAWLLYYGEWPSERIDHRDTDRANNRIANLRQATNSQNMANAPLRCTNTVGLKGVSFVARKGKYRSYIVVNGRQLHLGYYTEKETAHAAYVTAANDHFGEFARAA